MKPIRVAVVLVFVWMPAQAGLTYRSESVTSGVKPHTFSGVAKIEGTNRRFDVVHNDGKLFATGSIILSSTKNHISTVLDPATKTYYVIDSDKLSATIAATQKELNQFLSTPEPHITVKDAGSGGIVAGFPTERWLMTITTDIRMRSHAITGDTHMVTSGTTWTTDRIPSDAATFLSESSISGADSILGAVSRAHEKMHGFPIKAEMTTKITMNGSTTTSTLRMSVTGVRPATFPASDFVVPAGYKQVESPIDAMLARAGIQ